MVEKAEVKRVKEIVLGIRSSYGDPYYEKDVVDKDSILNAVDLNEFIK